MKENENCNASSFYKNDSLCCACSNRPYKNINDQLRVDKTIHQAFKEFIHKPRENDMAWSHNINSSISCCLVITKLVMIVEVDWTVEYLYQYKKLHQGQ